MKKLLLNTVFAIGATCLAFAAQAQTGIGTTYPDSSARLEVSSTTQGFLPPRMTTAQRDAITSPAPGLLVYNTTLGCLQVHTGTAAAPVWQCLTGGGATNASAILPEVLEGNAGCTALIQELGAQLNTNSLSKVDHVISSAQTGLTNNSRITFNAVTTGNIPVSSAAGGGISLTAGKT